MFVLLWTSQGPPQILNSPSSTPLIYHVIDFNSLTNNLRHCQDQELSNLVSFLLPSSFCLLLYQPSDLHPALTPSQRPSTIQHRCDAFSFYSIYPSKIPVPAQSLEFRISDFLLHCLIVQKIILDCWNIQLCWYWLIQEFNASFLLLRS